MVPGGSLLFGVSRAPMPLRDDGTGGSLLFGVSRTPMPPVRRQFLTPPHAIVPPDALRRRPARLLRHRPEPPSLLPSPDRPCAAPPPSGRSSRRPIRRPALGGPEAARDRARAPSAGAVRGSRPRRGDRHPTRDAVPGARPGEGGGAHSGSAAARRRRRLSGAPAGRRRTVESLPKKRRWMPCGGSPRVWTAPSCPSRDRPAAARPTPARG